MVLLFFFPVEVHFQNLSTIRDQWRIQSCLSGNFNQHLLKKTSHIMLRVLLIFMILFSFRFVIPSLPFIRVLARMSTNENQTHVLFLIWNDWCKRFLEFHNYPRAVSPNQIQYRASCSMLSSDPSLATLILPHSCWWALVLRFSVTMSLLSTRMKTTAHRLQYKTQIDKIAPIYVNRYLAMDSINGINTMQSVSLAEAIE